MIVYCILNKINGKRYIGQTTISISARYPGGIFRRPSNRHLANAYKYYGKSAFECYEIIKCLDLCALNYWEKYYINLYKSYDRDKGYNIYAGGDNFKVTTEIRKIRSKIAKDYITKNPEELNRLQKLNLEYWSIKESRIKKSEQMKRICNDPNKQLHMAIVQGSKPFKVFKKDTNEFIGTWINKSECARELNIDSRKVCACLLGRRKSHKGYTFIVEAT